LTLIIVFEPLQKSWELVSGKAENHILLAGYPGKGEK